MHFQPLQAGDLSEAQRVASELFPWEEEHQAALAAALAPASHAGFYESRRLAAVRCWTAHGSPAGVCGLAALYSYRAQPDEAWLAWFGLRPESRGQGAGGQLLDRLIEGLRNEGRRTLRLWTTDEAEYAVATQLYLRRGFVAEEHPPLPGEQWRTLVFSRSLDGHPPIPWSAVLDRGELCGRQVAVCARAAA